MTGFIYHQAYLQHNPGWGHPESSDRLKVIKQAYDNLNRRDKTILHTPRPATEDEITAVHTGEYFREMRTVCLTGGYHRGIESELDSASWEAALFAAGGGIEASEKVLSGEWNNAFCALRPPGHHATPNLAMGFCLFNNIAAAAAQLLKKGAGKILIVDWDVHHGNGTQEIFYSSDEVFYYSTHQRNLYPYGSGDESQTGAGKGEGFTLNRPIEPGAPADEYLRLFHQDLNTIEGRFQPEIALISCGFDVCKGDTLGRLNLSGVHLAEMTQAVSRLAGGKIVSFLEGGYNLNSIVDGFIGHFQALLDLP